MELSNTYGTHTHREGGMKTRELMLDCLRQVLDETPLHHVKIIDVARRANKSAATFYQHFPSLDQAMLELAPEDGEWTAPAKARMWEHQVRHAISVMDRLGMLVDTK